MLLAVHISDLVLAQPWVLAGWLGAALLALLGSWRLREEEIPRIALLTAAFFVASSIHPPIPGPSRTHLLLNGLVGVVLGRRAALAIPIGLFMQAALLGHGAYSTLGVNSCIQVLPALGAGLAFAGLRRVAWVGHPVGRATLVFVSSLVFALSLASCFGLAFSWTWNDGNAWHPESALVALLPPVLAVACAFAGGCVWLERSLDHPPEFPLGLLIGELTVLATVGLLCAVLILGGEQDWHVWALAQFALHLPIAVLEGIVLGFTVGFLVRVKPELLGWTAKEEAV